MAGAWINETLPEVNSSITTRPFKSQFSALTTNADRVQFCLSQKEVQRWVGLFVSKFPPSQNGSKCSTTAGKFREKGNDHFREHKFESAIQLYSRAICFAPQTVDNTASELALAYGNRSAAYFRLGQYDNALKDINVALARGYGQFKSVIKLQLRKCDCLIQLGRASEAEEFLNFMQKPTGDENDTKRWIELFDQINLDDDKLKDESPKEIKVSLIGKLTNKGLFKSNEKMSSFSAKVAVQYDEVKGRHLVAQEDIQFGDILAVSRPYVTLLNLEDDVLKYCHHCCRDLKSALIRPIPCTSCSSAVYCTEECRTEAANSYHRYECGQNDLMAKLPEFPRMSLRLLYRAGIDQIRSVVDSPENANHLSEQPEDHYSHVYQLVHHSDGPLKDLNISYDDMLELSILACLLLQLVKSGNFPVDSKEDEKLIGGILSRHLLQSRFNAFDYCPFNKKGPFSPVLLDFYPRYAATLNHSCKANARLESANDERVCLLQAARLISAGTEITITYYSKDKDPNEIPQQFKDRFFVSCFCARCIYYARNTPFGLTAEYLPLKCRECGHLMELSSEHRSESEVFGCTNCQLTMTNDEMKLLYRMIDEMQRTFSRARSYYKLFETKQFPALALKAEVDQIEDFLHRNSSLMVGNLRFKLGEKYLTDGEMDKSWACIEQSLSVHERVFGGESVELMEALDLLQSIGTAKPVKMKAFEREAKWLYPGYFARMEKLKQLKRKYYPDY